MDLQKELARCAKCGQCRSVCPVFLALKDETLVARGRLAIIQAGQAGQQMSAIRAPWRFGATNRPTDQFRKILDTCLMCRRCEENCPSLVETSVVFKSERQRVTDEKGLPWLLRLGFRWVLPNRWLYNSMMRLASLAGWLFGRGGAPVRHLPLYFANLFPDALVGTPLRLRQRMPRLAKKSALQLRHSSLDISHSPKVSIFLGCAANYIYPEIIEALTSILDRLKIPYVIPQAQVCCGMPALLSGDEQSAKRLMKMNQETFKTETIITVCPTCNRMLREMRSSEWGMGNKIVDAVEFLETELTQFRIPHSAFRTAYHTPCHSAGTKAPEIIKAFLKANTDYQEIDDICCGGGGLFTFKYPELSDLIGQARVDSLRGSLITQSPNHPITQLVTNCPGCMMQLEYLLSSGKHTVKVRHIVNLIMDAHKTGRPAPHTHK
ncbi:MAG: (Fe-S)-binding protein [Planctomycetes bacterium]|nr:(Fe-S)-binding protein [Planctomycetota bacterium]